MSERARDIFSAVMVVFLAVVAFAAGYLVNDFVELRQAASSSNSNGESIEGEFAIFWEAWQYVEKSYIG